jgi:hypothetical protein
MRGKLYDSCLNDDHVSLLFHLFDEEKQLALAKQLANLLSPEPGSIISGVHGGLNTKDMKLSYSRRQMFCHWPESWGRIMGWARCLQEGEGQS